MAVSFFKYFGVNVEDSVLAQMPVLTPALGAPMDVEGVASMDMEGVLQDSLQKFKKEVEDVQGEYFAGMARAGLNLVDLFRGVRGVGRQQAVDMAVWLKMFEGMKELYDNAQRKILKAFEDDVKWFSTDGPDKTGAPLLPASTGVGEAEAPKLPAKPAGITVVSTTASTSGVDAVPPAATRRRARRNRKRKSAVPLVTKGPAVRHGTIVGVNHEKKFAFIRTSRDTTDFYVGQRQYHRGMAMGDEVSFCELEPRGRRRRCPEAYRVDLLARAWTWYHRPYGAWKRSGL